MAGLELPSAALLSNTQGSLHRRESDQEVLCDDGTFIISDKITCSFAQETYPGEIDLAEFPTKQHALSLRTFDSSSACNGSLVLDHDDGLHILQRSRSLSVVVDPNIVDWDGPDDPRNPHNWPASRKWAITVVSKSKTINVMAMLLLIHYQFLLLR